VIFRGIFLGISWGNNFFVTFSAENSNFPPTLLRGKISAEFPPPPKKNIQKIGQIHTSHHKKIDTLLQNLPKQERKKCFN
jgi:hypothetical protein